MVSFPITFLGEAEKIIFFPMIDISFTGKIIPEEISMISFPSGLPEEAERNISKVFCANLPGIWVIIIKL